MSSRLPSLLRALQTLALAALRLLYAPTWTRAFLAYVYEYRPLRYVSRIRCVSLKEVLPRAETINITLRNTFPQHGNMTGTEIINIAVLVQWAAPRRIFEFGTFNGTTTLQMTLNAPLPREILTLNLPPDHGDTKFDSSEQDKMVHPRVAGSGQAFGNQPERANIRELFGDSARFDYSPYAASCDLVLIDAGHEYDYVRSDTENARRLLKPEGGVLIWHDFPNAPGVRRYLEELSETLTVFHIRDTHIAFSVIGTRDALKLLGS